MPRDRNGQVDPDKFEEYRVNKSSIATVIYTHNDGEWLKSTRSVNIREME